MPFLLDHPARSRFRGYAQFFCILLPSVGTGGRLILNYFFDNIVIDVFFLSLRVHQSLFRSIDGIQGRLKYFQTFHVCSFQGAAD